MSSPYSVKRTIYITVHTPALAPEIMDYIRDVDSGSDLKVITTQSNTHGRFSFTTTFGLLFLVSPSVPFTTPYTFPPLQESNQGRLHTELRRQLCQRQVVLLPLLAFSGRGCVLHYPLHCRNRSSFLPDDQNKNLVFSPFCIGGLCKWDKDSVAWTNRHKPMFSTN
jgi:hypothetical protein